MNADVKGALEQINKSYKSFTHDGYTMSKQAVKKVLEYALAKGYEHTGQLSNAEIDMVLTKGTTVEQWERYYEDKKAHDEYCEKVKPIPPPLYFTHYKPTEKWPTHAETAEQAALIYQKAMSEWQMMRSCDAPNKPGYYRANND